MNLTPSDENLPDQPSESREPEYWGDFAKLNFPRETYAAELDKACTL
jgi:hypothetical protein